jgi:putative cardiolipin synthase
MQPWSFVRAFVAVVLSVLFAGCSSLPSQVERTASSALTNTDDTPLGRALRPEIAAHPGKSGIHPLSVPQDAFAARILLARSAQRSLDLQYYIWHDDITGQMLWEAVWQAAERGVRVRMLIDDQNTKGLDATLATLDAHPNIEVRLFNPFANRGFRLGDFATDFSRVNRRMHNKSFTADNQVAIVGGRNVGDEYFGANPEVGFQDLDVMAVGPVVREVSSEFDLFWNSASAYPAASVLPAAPREGAVKLQEEWRQVQQSPEAQRYVEAVRQTPLVHQLLDRSLGFDWTTARVVHDDPAKVLNPPERSDLQMLPHLEEVLGKASRQLDLVSPYFVPGQGGTQGLVTLARQGVKVRVLTNSLAATDVGPVHAGYSKYRQDLLDAGITLYELKPDAAMPSTKAEAKRRGVGGSSAASAASLHAKTFSVDRSRVFVGSFNLDPRSARLNTEMGLVIDSPVLAGQLSDALDNLLPKEAYRVSLRPQGPGLEWTDETAQGEVRYTTEPGAGPMRRLWIDFLSVLPIEWLL